MARTGSRPYRRNRATILQGTTTCHLCGDPIDPTLDQYHPMSGTAHHLVPYAHGGTDDLTNLVPAHLECNQRQGDKLTTVINRRSRAWT